MSPHSSPAPARPAKKHTLILLKMSAAASLRRLRQDLATEVVVAICVAVLLGTFFYVFNDFINTQVATLSLPMKNSLSEWFSRIVILTCGIWGGSGYSREKRDPDSLHALAIRLGEFPAVARMYLVGRRLQWFLLFVGGSWILVARFFPPIDASAIGLRMLFALCGWTIGRLSGGTAVTANRQLENSSPMQSAIEKTASGTVLSRPSRHMIRALVQWRLLQLGRNRSTRSLFGIGCGFVMLAAVVAARSGPEFAVVLCGFAGGFCAAATIPIQVQSDLQNAWIERSSGIAHNDYMKAIRQVSMLLGAASAILSGLTILSVQVLTNSSLKPAFLIALVSAVPSWSMPAIIFQIDARRSAATILAAVIVTLFLATAVYAHWLSLLLLPIMSWYADNMQARRFHRA